MPQYLAIDYQEKHLEEKRKKLEDILRLLLPVPLHLELHNYVHSGRVPDGTYRKPWSRIDPSKHSMKVEDEDAAKVQKLMTTLKLEPFCRHIVWPQRAEFAEKAQQFYAIRQFPSVIGAVDGTHIPIRNPTMGNRDFYNRKGFPSINVMVVVNADMTFSYIDANFPGSANDAYVMKSSPVWNFGMEGDFDGYHLLGDSGKSCQDTGSTHDWEVVPSSNPESQEFLEEEVKVRKKHDLVASITSETFRPVDLKEYESEYGNGYLLEEPLEESILKRYKQQLPLFSSLMSKLPLQPLEDPLKSDEKEIIRYEQTYPSENILQSQSDDFTEEFKKEKLVNTESECLDDELIRHGIQRNKSPSLPKLTEVAKQEETGASFDVGEKDDSNRGAKEELLSVPTPTERNSSQTRDTPTTAEFTTLKNKETSGECLADISGVKEVLPDVPIQTEINSLPSQVASKAVEVTFLENQEPVPDILQEPVISQKECRTTSYSELLRHLHLKQQLCEEHHLPSVTLDYKEVIDPTLKFSQEKLSTGIMEERKKFPTNIEEFRKVELGNVIECQAYKDIIETDSYILEQLSGGIMEEAKSNSTSIRAERNVRFGHQEDGQEKRPMKEELPYPRRRKAKNLPPLDLDPLTEFIWIKKHRSIEQRENNSPQQEVKFWDNIQALKKQDKARESSRGSSEKQKQENPPQSSVGRIRKETIKDSKNVGGSQGILYNRIIQVPFTGDYQIAVKCLQRSAVPLLKNLQSHGLLPPNQNLEGLTPAITKFILRQQRKTRERAQEAVSEDEERARMEIYQSVVGLHSLVDALHTLYHACLPSAASLISEIQQQYGDMPHHLEQVRKQLFEIHVCSSKAHVLHPKILTMCGVISERRKATDGAATMPAGAKILVVVKNLSSTLANCIKDGVDTVEGICCEIINKEQIENKDYLSESAANCHITGMSQVEVLNLEDFWLIIEYEYREPSSLRARCSQISHNFLGLIVATKGLNSAAEEGNGREEMVMGTPFESLEVNSDVPQYVFIGSLDITSNTELLHLLEARYNILIVERDYRLQGQAYQERYFTDIVVDERTGVLLVKLCDLKDVKTVSPLIIKLTHLSLKYHHCWLILQASSPNSARKDDYPYSGQVTYSLARLYAGISQLLIVTPNYQIHILNSGSLSMTAGFLRKIGKLACTDSPVWKENDWLNRAWLTPNMTKHEKFLLAFPCFNAFSAQLLLTRLSLQEVVSLNFPQISRICPWLPPNVVQYFYMLLNVDSGLNLAPHLQDLPHAEETEPEKVTEQTFHRRDQDRKLVNPSPLPSNRNNPFQNETKRSCGGLLLESPPNEPLVDLTFDDPVKITNEYERACLEYQEYPPTSTLDAAYLDVIKPIKTEPMHETRYISEDIKGGGNLAGTEAGGSTNMNTYRSNMDFINMIPDQFNLCQAVSQHLKAAGSESKLNKPETQPLDREIRHTYSNRSKLNLWTEFGDRSARQSAYLQKKDLPRQDTKENSWNFTESTIPKVGGSHQYPRGPKQAGRRVPQLGFSYNLNQKQNMHYQCVQGAVTGLGAKKQPQSMEDLPNPLERMSKNPAGREEDGDWGYILPRTPDHRKGIAPVSPKVRLPLQALHLGSPQRSEIEETRSTKTIEGRRLRAELRPFTEDCRVPWISRSSPPMDLSQEARDFYSFNQFSGRGGGGDQVLPRPIENCHLDNGEETSIFEDSSHFHKSPQNKIRKLTYERVAGAPKGQTRLSFI